MVKLFIVLAIAAVFVVIVGSLVFGYFGFQNNCNKFEIDIKAKYQDNQNTYDNGYKKVLEIAQVPEMYGNQLKELYKEAMSDRYGEKGSQALLQFIKEQNPTSPPEIFTKVQQTIESFRNEFRNAQNGLISIVQVYEAYYGATYSGRFYNMFGHYPKIDLKDYRPVTSGRTEDVFKTKQDEPLQLPK